VYQLLSFRLAEIAYIYNFFAMYTDGIGDNHSTKLMFFEALVGRLGGGTPMKRDSSMSG